jgi:hypothetical protein
VGPGVGTEGVTDHNLNACGEDLENSAYRCQCSLFKSETGGTWSLFKSEVTRITEFKSLRVLESQ